MGRAGTHGLGARCVLLRELGAQAAATRAVPPAVAVNLEFVYTPVDRQVHGDCTGIRICRDEPFVLRVGERAEGGA